MPAGKLTLVARPPPRSKAVSSTRKTRAKHYQRPVQPVAVMKTKFKSSIPRSAYGKGRSMILKMPYSDMITLDSGVAPAINANLDPKVYALNSITLPRSDPLQAVGNYLPQNLNSVENVFYYYKVLGCKVRLEFTDPNIDTRVGVLLTGSQDAQTLSGTNASQIENKLGSTYLNITPDGEKNRVYSRYIPIHSIEGLTKQQFNDAIVGYSSLITSSRASAIAQEDTATAGRLIMRKPKLHFAVAPVQSLQTTVRVKIDLTYYVKCYNKMTIPITTTAV